MAKGWKHVLYKGHRSKIEGIQGTKHKHADNKHTS